MNIQIFIPCFIDQLFPETAFNMVKVLEKAGCTVSYNPAQTCCGQPAYNAGFLNEAKQVVTKFRRDFSEDIPVVCPSASCTGFIRNYQPSLLSNKPATAAYIHSKEKYFEFSEFLTEVLGVEEFNAEFNAIATYHDSCAALRECKIKEGPRKLLSHVKGLTLTEMADNETCCGFGGTFAVKFAPISVAMAQQKITNAIASGAEYIISTDLSCLMQIDSVCKKEKVSLKSIHLADVLAAGW